MSTPQGWRKVDPPHTEEDKRRVPKIEHQYRTVGKKLYSRETLKKILEVVNDYKAGKYENKDPPTLEIPDYAEDGNRTYTLTLDVGYHGDELKRLQYIPIQFLMQPYYHRQMYPEDEYVQPIRIYKGDEFEKCGMGDSTPADLRDLEKIRDECSQKWKNSGTRASVMAALDNISVEKLTKVTQIIAFGNGSLWQGFRKLKVAGTDRGNLLRRTAQHVAINEIQAFAQRKCGHPVPTYAQDPGYTLQDEEIVLKPFQIKRLEDPEGFLKIDAGTIIFAFETSCAFLQAIADVIEDAGPAIIFHQEILKDVPWGDYKVALEYVEDGFLRPVAGCINNETSPRVEKLLQNYQERELEDPDEVLVRTKTRLYVRN